MRIIWCSRHEMSAEQLADLCSTAQVVVDAVVVENRNITWAATADAAADAVRNSAQWEELYAAVGRGGIIAGVFPPVAMEARRPFGQTGIRIASPVSRQAPELRVGDGQIPFAHVRWAWPRLAQEER
jgi:hypothetical protein